MNNDLDINILIQCFNEKISQMMTEIIVKEATIKQLSGKLQAIVGEQKTSKATKTKTDDFE